MEAGDNVIVHHPGEFKRGAVVVQADEDDVVVRFHDGEELVCERSLYDQTTQGPIEKLKLKG